MPFSSSLHPTPVGDALIVVSDAGLVALRIVDGSPGPELERVTRALRDMPHPDPSRTAAVEAQVDEYFAGARRDFDLDIDWTLAPGGFARRALDAVCDIPYGETASYGDVAVAAGSPGAHRAVGTACGHTPISIVIPVHRVVRADGSLGDYGGHPEIKAFLHDLEAPHA